MALAKEKKTEIIGKHRINDQDTGSADVQIALLTGRIKSMIEHMKVNKKDQHSRHGLLLMVERRRKLMKYLGRTDKDRFDTLVKELGL